MAAACVPTAPAHATGALRRQGERLASAAGQTQARWQLLSAASDGDWTVAHIARRLGISRQAVQRVADELRVDGLVATERNPYHQRSPLIRPTAEGRAALAEITAAAERWNAELAAALDAADVVAARQLLHALIAASG